MIFRRDFLKSSLLLLFPNRKQRVIKFNPIEKYNLSWYENTRFTYEMKKIILKTEYIEPIILKPIINEGKVISYRLIDGWHQIRRR